MHHKIRAAADAMILRELRKLPEDVQRRFKVTFCQTGTRGYSASAALSIVEAVREVPAAKLDRAVDWVDDEAVKFVRRIQEF